MNDYQIWSAGDPVTTDTLEFFPSTGLGIYSDMLQMGQKYDVSIELLIEPKSFGGYPIRIRGEYQNVYRCVAEQWGSNETADTLDHYVHMVLGDPLAAHRWNTGCRKTNANTGPNYSSYAWDEHWKRVGADPGRGDEKFDEANDLAIDYLVESGAEVPNGTIQTEHTDFAQTYLALAFLNEPALFDTMAQMIRDRRRKVNRPEQINMDAFNLFDGATFIHGGEVWTVMTFTDNGGSTALSRPDETVTVLCRMPDQAGEETIPVREFTFHYCDKVGLIGAVRNPMDLDDNNWGQN